MNKPSKAAKAGANGANKANKPRKANKPNKANNVHGPSAADRPIELALGFLIVGVLGLLLATGHLGAVGRWLYDAQEDPSPAWVWACGGMGCVAIGIAFLLTKKSYDPHPLSPLLGGVGLLHLFVFFVALLF